MNEEGQQLISLDEVGDEVGQPKVWDEGPDGENVYELTTLERAERMGPDGTTRKQLRIRQTRIDPETGENAQATSYWLNLPLKVGEGGRVVYDGEWNSVFDGFARAAFDSSIPYRPSFDKKTKKRYNGTQELSQAEGEEARRRNDEALKKAAVALYNDPSIIAGRRVMATKSSKEGNNGRQLINFSHFKGV